MLAVMRIANPQISFADAELIRQGVQLDPVLAKISDFIDEHDELVVLVRRDLERGLKKPKTGRRGLTPNQVLRSLILVDQELGLPRTVRADPGWIHAA